jgi:hypothetical protein
LFIIITSANEGLLGPESNVEKRTCTSKLFKKHGDLYENKWTAFAWILVLHKSYITVRAPVFWAGEIAKLDDLPERLSVGIVFD